jgi:signal transduction histidine kinase
MALSALLAQNMLATILRKQLVERAVVARTSELVTANSSLREEIEQRRQAEAELRLARDRAESASRAKTSFLATMSHELRTPLNAIIGFSSILAQAPETPRQAEYSGEILRSGKRLLDLINDILDITHMESDGAAAAGDDAIYLDDCVESVMQDLQTVADTAGVMLKASIPPGLPALHGEVKRLTRALWHLVSNAIKFTPQGGAAVVTASTFADESLIVDVIDTGVGTAPEAQQKIREAFSQQEGYLSRRFEGVGLGLTYVRKVVELHGARLDIVSEVNKGTRVRIIFPRHRLSQSREVA